MVAKSTVNRICFEKSREAEAGKETRILHRMALDNLTPSGGEDLGIGHWAKGSSYLGLLPGLYGHI